MVASESFILGMYRLLMGILILGAACSKGSGTLTVDTSDKPAIKLSQSALTFAAALGGANPSMQSVTLSNSGGGTLTGLNTGPVAYTGGASGWLAPILNSAIANPSATLLVQPITATLSPGTYSATIPVLADGAVNSPQSIAVTLTVGAASTQRLTLTVTGSGSVAISPSSLNGSSCVSPTTVSCVADFNNGQAVTLVATPDAGLSFTGWSGSCSGTTQCNITMDQARSIIATFTATTPRIALSSNALTFNTAAGSPNPQSQSVNITNGGVATLSGIAVGNIVYGSGAFGWLQAPVLNTPTAPSTLTIQPVTGVLGAGTYTATIPIASAVATNSPQTVSVTLNVAPPGPAIAFSNASLVFNAPWDGANPASQSTTVTNGGGGTLSGLSVGGVSYGPGGFGWVQSASLNSTTASALLTVQPATGTLDPGTYTALIAVQSSVATNSPRSVTATFTVDAPNPTTAKLYLDGVEYPTSLSFRRGNSYTMQVRLFAADGTPITKLPPGKIITMRMTGSELYGPIGPAVSIPDGFHFTAVIGTNYWGGSGLYIYYGTPTDPTARFLKSVSLSIQCC